MMPLRTFLLLLMLLAFSSQGVAHDHLQNDLERESSCLVCSFTDGVPLATSLAQPPLWTDPAGAMAWPHVWDLGPRDCPEDCLGRGPPLSR